MDISWPENTTADRIKAIEKLILGRQFADQLRLMLRRPSGDDVSSSLSDVVLKILDTFTDSISILSSPASSGEVSQIPASSPASSPASDRRKSEGSGDSTKTNSPVKDRRGCYKRRKTSQTWTRITPTLMDDGHAWRKYGQKIILHATHPRNYYRCTHKFDQGCHASKQVQRTEDNPPMYKITYTGQHTCKNLLKSPHFLLEPSSDPSTFLLSFGSTHLPPTHPIHDPFYAPFDSVKREEPHCYIPCTSSAADYEDLISGRNCHVETSEPSDHGDVISSSGVYSCTASTHSLDMDFMVGSADFEDDVLQYEFC